MITQGAHEYSRLAQHRRRAGQAGDATASPGGDLIDECPFSGRNLDGGSAARERPGVRREAESAAAKNGGLSGEVDSQGRTEGSALAQLVRRRRPGHHGHDEGACLAGNDFGRRQRTIEVMKLVIGADRRGDCFFREIMAISGCGAVENDAAGVVAASIFAVVAIF